MGFSYFQFFANLRKIFPTLFCSSPAYREIKWQRRRGEVGRRDGRLPCSTLPFHPGKMQIYKYTNTQIHKYTNTQIQIQVKLDDVTFASLVQRSRFKPGGKMREGYFCFSYLRFRPRCTHSASASYSRDEGFSFPSRLFSKFSMRVPWPTLWCSRQSMNPTKS